MDKEYKSCCNNKNWDYSQRMKKYIEDAQILNLELRKVN